MIDKLLLNRNLKYLLLTKHSRSIKLTEVCIYESITFSKLDKLASFGIHLELGKSTSNQINDLI